MIILAFIFGLYLGYVMKGDIDTWSQKNSKKN